jgi:type II secretory ATPase GspE/PulE/Tfp pilus assembly ATPase PilB-like protein
MIAEGKDMKTIEAYARKNQGLRTLREQAAELVCRGVTTPEEAMRIVSYE